MNDISIFNNDQFGEMRVVMKDGEPWFVAKEICAYFGDSNYRRSVARLDDDEKGVSPLHTPGGIQSLTVVNEAGLYSLLFHMQPQDKQGMPAGEFERRVFLLKAFKRWVTHEVLPSIRKHGAYIPVNEGDTPDIIMARGLKAAESIVQELKTKIEADAPKVAFHDQFLDAGDDISVGALAKKLAQEGLPFGQNRLFEYLRQQKVLCSKRGINFNMPIQKYVDRGWFRVIAPRPSMYDRWKAQVYITPKGVKEISARIHELFSQAAFQ